MLVSRIQGMLRQTYELYYCSYSKWWEACERGDLPTELDLIVPGKQVDEIDTPLPAQ